MASTQQRLNKWANRIADYCDERAMGEGVWITLRSGWQDASNPTCHTIHEDTPQFALDLVAMAIPCECAECRADLAKAEHEALRPANIRTAPE